MKDTKEALNPVSKDLLDRAIDILLDIEMSQLLETEEGAKHAKAIENFFNLLDEEIELRYNNKDIIPIKNE